MTQVFCDTETTGLDPDDDSDIWEFAAVRRNGNWSGSYHAFVQHDVEKALALPEPFLSDYKARYDPAKAMSREGFRLYADGVFTRDGDGKRPHLIGAVPDFDTAGLRRLMGVKRSDSPWHYHLIDVETLMVGFIKAKFGIVVPQPWNSDMLSMMVGVDPSKFDRHTGMGDVRWTMANYDAVMA